MNRSSRLIFKYLLVRLRLFGTSDKSTVLYIYEGTSSY